MPTDKTAPPSAADKLVWPDRTRESLLSDYLRETSNGWARQPDLGTRSKPVPSVNPGAVKLKDPAELLLPKVDLYGGDPSKSPVDVDFVRLLSNRRDKQLSPNLLPSLELSAPPGAPRMAVSIEDFKSHQILRAYFHGDGLPRDQSVDSTKFMKMIDTALIEKHDNISGEFSKVIDKTIKDLPPSVRIALARNGYSIVVSDRLTNAMPELKNKQPRGWPAGSTWDQSDGLQTCDKKIGIAETKYVGNSWVKTERGAGVLRHEIGHAIDLLMGKEQLQYSGSTEFKVAYERDTTNIARTDRDKLHYYLQEGQPGRAETFADMFATQFGGPCNEQEREVLTRAFPEVAKVISTKIGRLVKEEPVPGVVLLADVYSR